MQTFDLYPPANSLHHECESYRDGDWIVFRCSHCATYERRFNWRTGAMKSQHGGSSILHTGMHSPKLYRDVFERGN